MTMQTQINPRLLPADPRRGRPGRMGGMMGRGGGPMAMMRGEKPRDFKGTMKKLIEYLGPTRFRF